MEKNSKKYIKYSKNVFFKLLIVLLVFFIVTPLKAFATEEYTTAIQDEVNKQQNVLCLSSFTDNFEWWKEIYKELNAELTVDNNVNLIVDYIDVDPSIKNEDKKSGAQYYKERIEKENINLLILIGDDIVEYIIDDLENISSLCPIVLGSVSQDIYDKVKDFKNIATVVEKPNVQGTIDLAAKIQKNSEKIIFINDNKHNLRNHITNDYEKEIINIESKDAIQTINELKKYSSDEIVIFNKASKANRDNISKLSSIDIKRICNNVEQPIFTLWTSFLKSGVIGGDLINGYKQGHVISKISLEILNGIKVEHLPDIYNKDKEYIRENYFYYRGIHSNPSKTLEEYTNDYKYTLDNLVLQRFNIEILDIKEKEAIYTTMLANNFKDKKDITNNVNNYVKSKPKTEVYFDKNEVSLINVPHRNKSTNKEFVICITICIIVIIVIAILLLISKNKEVEAELSLSESEEKLKILMDSMPDLICFKDGEGKWIQCNETIKNAFNLKDEGYVGKTDLELELLNEKFANYFKRCRRSDVIAWQKREIYRFETYIPGTDNKNKIYEVIKLPTFNKNGDRKALVVLGRDITERKLSERKLEISEERYRNLIDSLPNAILMCDIDNRIMFLNKIAMDILGLDGYKDLKGHKLEEIFYQNKGRTLQEINQEGFNEKEIYGLEEKLKRKDGNIFEAKLSFIGFNDEHKGNFTVLITDLTEVKKAEKLQRKVKEKNKLLLEAREYDRIKTEFFSNISHELRTPLNVMFSSIQLLELYKEKGEIIDSKNNLDKRLYVLKQNSFRLLRLVNNLIDITKIDAGFFDINTINSDIISTIENITLSVADFAENQGISLIFDTDVEEMIMSFDPDKIERIILNLLANAVKFTDEGGSIFVDIKCVENNIQISIRDTGIGIPEEKLEIIFDRFRQVDKSLTRVREGSGIGLSLVKSLVNLHGGKISVKSALGKGTEFIIILPINLNYDKDICLEMDNDEERIIQKIDIEFSDIYT